MRLISPAVIFALAGVLAAPAYAEGGADGWVKEAIQLNQRAPDELVLRKDTTFVLVAWNGAEEKWIELFRGEGPFELGEPEANAFATVTYQNYNWIWDGKRYVPRLPEGEPGPKSSILTDVAKAIEGLVGATVPASTQAYIYREADGSEVRFAVLDQSLDTCTAGGEFCSAVIVREGEVMRDIGASLAYGFRFSERVNDNGHRYIENGREDGVYFVDPDTGKEVSSVEAQKVTYSPVQPQPPY